MKQCRSGRLQDACNAKSDQPGVESYDDPVIPVDSFHQKIT